MQQLDEEFVAFSDANPDLKLLRLDPDWSTTYLSHLFAQYKIARDGVVDDLNLAGKDIPVVPTLDELTAENPWPDPATYIIADATSNETVSPLTGTQFAVGDALVLCVDRIKLNQSTGEALGVHTVPCLLKDELLNLMQTDAGFLAEMQALLGVP